MIARNKSVDQPTSNLTFTFTFPFCFLSSHTAGSDQDLEQLSGLFLLNLQMFSSIQLPNWATSVKICGKPFETQVELKIVEIIPICA
jgi:hypothetical protein